MALIEIETELTVEQRTRKRVQQTLRSGYLALRGTLDMVRRLVWDNPDLTPQQVFDLFGSDAAQLCAVSDGAKQLLALAGENVGPILPPGKTLTINPDGTVVVGQT